MQLHFAVLYLFIVAVTAQEQNGQNQIQRVQVPTLINQPPSQNAFSGLPKQVNLSPCRRKNTFNRNMNVPESNLVPYFNSKIVYPLDQKILKDTVEDEQILSKQSLKENTGAEKEKEQNMVIEKAAQNQEKETSGGTEAASQMLSKTSSPAEDRSEKTFVLCDKIEDVQDNIDGDEENDDSKTVEMQEQIIKLLLKCVQNRKNAARNLNSRRSLTKSVVPSSKMSSSPTSGVSVRDNDFDKDGPVLKKDESDKSAALEFPEPDNIENSEEKSKLPNDNADDVVSRLQHPARGQGIMNIAHSQVLLMENTRVCYACSSASDPSCWHPDRTTTIKYCKKEDTACVTKTYERKGELILIRDCGNTCNDHDIPGVLPKYKSCRICHSDTCNSANSINNINILLLSFIITAFKYALR